MKLSIADLVDNCSAEELMIGKEERELTARVKARVLAEIEAESKAAKPKKEIVHIRSRRVITFAFAAALLLSLGIVAYAISSIHAARQQELRTERNLNEHQTESYVEYETPDESTPGVVLLSTINDGEFQEVYVNVSPVTEEEIAGYPEQPISFRWQIVGSDLKGFADPWIRPGSSAHTPEALRSLVQRDAYDAETQTLTLCCHVFSESLAAFLVWPKTISPQGALAAFR